MEIAGVITGILSCACPPLCSFFGRQCDYVKNLKENEETLSREIDILKSQQSNICATLRKDKVQLGKKPKKEVLKWLENVQKFINEVDGMKNQFEDGKCFMGCISKCDSRLKLGKHIIKMIQEVKGLQDMIRQIDGLYVDSFSQPAKVLPTSTLFGETANRTRDSIWQYIMDAKISKIGVFGMGGVGKTTIMRHIYNQLNGTTNFDIIMWVTVSKALNMEKLQNDVAKCLGCDLSSSMDAIGRSMEIHEAFLRRKNFVLILDDMWKTFNLEDLGIPEPNQGNGSKIVLTTRLAGVCQQMESQKTVKVEVLTEDEAWSLFKDKVGDVVLSHEIKPIAELVAKECDRLPLALITVGRAMRDVSNVTFWNNALEELKSSSKDFASMEELVFERLMFSYNRLKSDKLRACFLYCALYPEDHDIVAKELTEYWMAEGLIEDVGDWNKEMMKGYSIVKELKDACMLESSKVVSDGIKMHDLIRDLAIIITTEQPLFLVKAGLGLKEPPKDEKWVESIKRISLIRNVISTFRGQPNCPNLETLLLQQNRILEEIPCLFFKHMPNLKVLDLSYTEVEQLPDSLSELENLHSLLLSRCRRLKSLPSLSRHKKLKMLNLNNTSIKELPHGFEDLVNLRYLDLSGTKELHVFPFGVLNKLSYIEILLMRGSGWKWSADSRNGADIWELLNLTRLSRLGAEFTDLQSFISYMKSEKRQVLKHFDLSVGSLPMSEWNCSIQLQDCEVVRRQNPIVLPTNTLLLNFNGCSDLNSLSDLSNSSNLMQLKTCVITRCEKLQWIEMDEHNSFPSLESVTLQCLPHFKGMCKGPLTNQAPLANLKILNISKCDQLGILISIEFLMSSLQNLEEVLVYKCKVMNEIVAKETGETTTFVIIPKLKVLNLRHLPSLNSICKGKLVCSSLCSIRIDECKKLKRLPISMQDIPPALKEIKGSKEWWNALQWDNIELKERLEPFFKGD